MKENFGTCCKDLKSAMFTEFESTFRVADTGVLYLTVGIMFSEEGPGYFDQAVMFCPFCGKELQTAEGVRQSSDETGAPLS